MKTNIKQHLLGAGLSLLVAFGLIRHAAAADESVAGELLVGFKPGIRGAMADGIRNGLGAIKIKAWPQISAEHWRLPAGHGVAQAIQALAANPNVLYAEPNYIVHASETPNDARLPELWGLHNLGQSGGAPDADIDAFEAWQLPPGSAPVVVGVIDSGIDYNHVDLAGRIWVNPGEIPGNGIDDDGNGYADDVMGWDFANNDRDPMDDHGHGTHVAGTIAASGNNGLGVIGVAGLNPNVKLMPLKFLDASGWGTTANAVSCITYAASFEDVSRNKIVRLTSNSWGGGGKSKTLEAAIKSCGALFVAAAGNNGTNLVFYPAGYVQPNVLAVAATDSADALASFSNFGSWVHVAAPGVSILSTTRSNTYGIMNGTSMATPHVSGVAALLLSQYPASAVADIRAQILNTVDVLPGLVSKVTTSGRLNARTALGAPELPPDTTGPTPITDLAAAPVSPYSVTLTWTAPSDDSGMTFLYDVRFSLNPIGTDAEFAAAGKASGEPVPQAPGTTQTFTLGQLLDNRTYYFAMKTIDVSGNASSISNPTSATTLIANWWYVGGSLDWGQDMGNYASLGIRSNGYWAVAFDDRANHLLKCAFLVPPGGGFRRETVMAGGYGPSLAYSPLEEISISHVDNSKRLWFVIQSGSNWISTQIEAKDVNPHETSMAYAGTDPVISYYKTARRSSGLWVARRAGSIWSTQLVEPGAVALYNQLAMDPAGNAAIAYSADANNDGTVDTLKFAQFNGAVWNLSVVDTGGSYGTLAYDTNGLPAVAHWNATTGELRFLRWSGTGWTSAEIVESGPSITGCSLQFGPDGRAFLAYGSTGAMRLAIRDPNLGVWTVQVVEESTSGSLRNSIRGRPQGTPGAVAYKGPPLYYSGSEVVAYPTSMHLAFRKTPY